MDSELEASGAAIAFPNRYNSVIAEWRNTASTSWTKKKKNPPGDCEGGAKHGGRRLKIRTLRFAHPDASQSDAIHEKPISAPEAHANEIRHAGVHLFRVATRLR